MKEFARRNWKKLVIFLAVLTGILLSIVTFGTVQQVSTPEKNRQTHPVIIGKSRKDTYRSSSTQKHTPKSLRKILEKSIKSKRQLPEPSNENHYSSSDDDNYIDNINDNENSIEDNSTSNTSSEKINNNSKNNSKTNKSTGVKNNQMTNNLAKGAGDASEKSSSKLLLLIILVILAAILAAGGLMYTKHK